jgi:hypothetical protein
MTEAPGTDRELLERVAQEIARRRLVAPAIFALESLRPLSFIASQAMLVFQPIVETILNVKDYERLTETLEDRQNLEWLTQRLEQLEDERGAGDKTPAAPKPTDEP